MSADARGILRFTRGHKCPVCGGCDDDDRGQGRRCHGFLSGSRQAVFCSREEHAGQARHDPKSGCYVHAARGPCACGTQHAPSDAAPRPGKRTPDRVYPYRDAAGAVLFEVVRFRDPKDFRQRRPLGNGQYQWDLKGIEPVLYNLPDLLAASPADPVWICEGEKDCDRLKALGLPIKLLTTTNPMGAGKWRDRYAEPLRDRTCYILPDNDQKGRDHAREVAASLYGMAASVKLVELPGLPEKGDVSDFLDAGGTVDRLRELAVNAAEWTPHVSGPAPSGEPAVANPSAQNRNGPNAGTKDPANLSSLTDGDLGLTIATDIQAMPVRWLWLYRLACGAMALLAGDGGIGKSLLLLWIAARVSRGDPWGDGSGKAPVGDVIVLSAEDRPEDTIVPRLMAMGADLSRITIMRARVVIREQGKEPTVSPMTFQDRAYWREVFGRRPGCILFIVDPLASYLGRGVSDARNNEVRGVLEPFLSEIIEPRGVNMLCNSHLNKSIDARSPAHRILGSIAFAALPRNVHLVVRDPENEARRYFAQAKCNNAPDDLPALVYTVERREVVTAAGEIIETAVPIFEVEPVQVRLSDLMAPKRDRETKRGEIDRATEWLKEKLADGPVGSILCAREGDRFLGRRWPDLSLPSEERRKIVLGRTKWWREQILKKRLGGESKRAGYNGPYLFRLPAHHWPPDPAAAVEAKRIDNEEMASTDSTDSTEGSTWIIPVRAVKAVEAVEAVPSCSVEAASTELEEGDI